MIQILVTLLSSGNKVYLDVGEVSIKANYSAVEIQDVTKRKAESTQTFSLPFTENNNLVFGHFYNINASTGAFDVNVRMPAVILVDGIEVLEGYLQLMKVNNSTEVYDVTVYGQLGNIIKSIEGKKLNDIDFSEFNHVFNRANIYNSWNNAIEYTDSSTGDEILYPIIDYGYDFTGITSTDSDRLTADRLKPAMKVQTIFYKILSDAGYSVNSTFLSTDFFTNQYMTLSSSQQVITNGESDGFKVYKNATQQVFSDQRQVLYFQDDSGTNSYNLNSNYHVNASVNADSYYDVPASGRYKFKVRLKIRPVDTEPFTNTIQYTITLRSGQSTGSPRLDGINVNGRQGPALQNAKGPDATGYVEFIMREIDLKDTDKVYFHFERYFAEPTEKTDILADSYVQLLEAPIQYIGTNIEFGSNNNLLPSNTQVEFLTSILNRYNLIIENDKDNPRQLNIEPAQNYFDAGISKDWTDKLDLSKNIVIKPTHEFQNAGLNLSDLEDDDWMSEEAQATNGVPYGSFQAKFPNEFTNGSDLEIDSMFSSFPTYNIGGMRMAQLFRWDNSAPQFVKTKPKLFYYSGKKSSPPYRFYTETGSSVYDTLSEYPFCSTFSMAGDEIEDSDYDIRFRSLESFGESDLIVTSTVNDVYTTCWSRYINSIYGPDARILIANFLLKPTDIADFRFNDKIFIKDAYYRINKIKSYPLGQDISTQIELIKIVDLVDNTAQPAFQCNNVIKTITEWGWVIFEDLDGNTAVTTRECCESYGYTFAPGTLGVPNICKALKSNDANVDPPPIVLNNSVIEIGEEGQEIIIEGGDLTSNITGNLRGDVLADNDDLVLENGATVSDAYLADGVKATTQPAGTNDTTIATTAFVVANGGTTNPAGSNTQVQFNNNGSFGADADFIYNTSTDTIEAPNATISGTITGDLTGNADTSTKIASITNSNIVQLTDTQTLTNKTLTDCEANTQTVGDNTTKVATTAFVQANSGSATPAGSNQQVQYNNNGSFGADFGMYYDNTTYSLNVFGTVDATLLDGNLTATSLLIDGVTATLQPLNDSSSKVATCSFVQQEITDATVTPGGVSYSIQLKSLNGNFSGYSQFKFNIDQTGGNLYMNGRATFGDANNGATGIYAFAIGTNTNATSQDAFALGENALASGRQSIAGGYECLAQGSASFAIGALTSSYGERSASFGSNSENYGKDSVVMGHNHTAATTSDRSLTLGYENTNNSSNSLLMGQSNTLLNLYAGGTSGGGTGCLVGGYNNSVQINDGIVFGSDCDAGVTSAGSNNSKNQFLFGLGLAVPKNTGGDAAGQSQTVVGKYNYDQNSAHLLFSVGYGTGPLLANRATAFLVTGNGQVGIKKTLPSYDLHLGTNSAAKPSTNTWTIASDVRVKENIQEYTKGLSEIVQLEPKTYDYNGKAGFDSSMKGNIGIIAQDVKDIFPETISTYNAKLNEEDEEETELYNFDSHALTFALINSVKELHAEIKTLKAEIKELKNK